MGWTKLSNGALLRQAAAVFDALLTADQNIEFQQNLETLPMAVVVLVAASNRLESLEPLVGDVLRVLETLQPKVLVRVGA
jgi:ABC-type glucose/galactose transport system permease subunit